MTTQSSNGHPSLNSSDRRPRRSPPGSCLHRYTTPPAPPPRDGLTARQSGELERIATRYGALRWRLRDDGTVSVAVLGDQPDPDDEVMLMLIRADGTLMCLRTGSRPRRDHLADHP
jgi:hypothetical protein